MQDLLELDEIQCRPDIVAAGIKLLMDPKHSHDGYDILGPLAAEGDVDAQFVMGQFCESVLERLESAAVWFQRAADQGHPQAQRNYADMLVTGRGVARNPKRAALYYEKAAIAGIPEAQFVLGEFLRNGDFISKDGGKALSWYQRAMRQGYEPAAMRIRTFYPNARI
jgi:TPR repeat protein